MKYLYQTIIKAPIGEVFPRFCNPQEMILWQDGLKSVEHISGTPFQEGSRTKMFYELGGRKLESVQTINKILSPKQFNAVYSSEGIDNHQSLDFSQNDRGDTIVRSKNVFVPLTLRMRLLIVFFPSTFKNQSKRYMYGFKRYIESEIAVTN